MVYVDHLCRRVLPATGGWRGWAYCCRIFADSLAEVRDFARLMGIPAEKLTHRPGGLPHYLGVRNVREKAIALGAVVADRDTVLRLEALARAGHYDQPMKEAG